MIIRKRLCSFLKKDEQGVTAIEYALIAPIFLMMLIAIFEIAAIMFVKASLELAVSQVARFGRTGDTEQGESRNKTAQDLAVKYSFGLIDPLQLRISIVSYNTFTDLENATTVPDTNQYDWGTGQEPVLYTMSYTWSLASTFGLASIDVSASSVIMNEPFKAEQS